MANAVLAAERAHLAALLEAVQRCSYFARAGELRLAWPLQGPELQARQKDLALFEALAAFNERFAKLQDTLAASMRHAALLLGEPTSPFLKVLAAFEKLGVLSSLEDWQACRTARNLAAHDYQTDYAAIAQHFNGLQALLPVLLGTAARLVPMCAAELSIHPASDAFETEFAEAVSPWSMRRDAAPPRPPGSSAA